MSQAPEPEKHHNETTLDDVKQLGLWAALGSLGYVFWIVGGMEMIERLAFYGVRTVSTLYVTRAKIRRRAGRDDGHLRLAAFRLDPDPVGGLDFHRRAVGPLRLQADDLHRHRHPVLRLPADGVGFHSYWGFFAGAMCLAVGTAIFKPGIQGTLIRSCNRRNSSVAWGVFYQTVNIGGWIGPLDRHANAPDGLEIRLLHQCRLHLPELRPLLLTYKEPGKEERLARRAQVKAGQVRENEPGFGVAAGTQETPPVSLSANLLAMVVHVPDAVGRAAEVCRGLGGYQHDRAHRSSGLMAPAAASSNS